MTTTRVQDERRAAHALERAALRRMVQPKNREKGPWSRDLRALIAAMRVELDEVEAALDADEGFERVAEELGDAAAFLAMAVDVHGCACCCRGDDHTVHCPGWFRNEETGIVERCDECGIYQTDEEVSEYLCIPHEVEPENFEPRVDTSTFPCWLCGSLTNESSRFARTAGCMQCGRVADAPDDCRAEP